MTRSTIAQYVLWVLMISSVCTVLVIGLAGGAR